MRFAVPTLARRAPHEWMQLAKQGKVRTIFGKDDGALSVQDFSRASALVADPNAVSRAILVGQMRELGVGTVMQVSRLADARAQLELREFDFVLCEREFPDEEATGEALLEDLRREQLIPWSGVRTAAPGSSRSSQPSWSGR